MQWKQVYGTSKGPCPTERIYDDARGDSGDGGDDGGGRVVGGGMKKWLTCVRWIVELVA